MLFDWLNRQKQTIRTILLVGGLATNGVAQPPTLWLNDRPVPPAEWLKAPVLYLPAREKSLTVRLEGRPSQWFEYRLQQNREVAWQSFKGQATLHFDNLAGSEYVFQVRQPTGNPFIERRIFVENALWQQWWFVPLLFVYGLFAMGAVMYVFFRYRLRQQLRLLTVRENIARDLHDDMGSYLGSISILSQSVLNVAQKDPQHARLLVDKIGETARQVMDSMSDIIWSINPENDSMAQIIVRMRDVATDLLGAQDIILHQDIDEAVSQTHLPLEQRRDFFLIYKEALTNIGKYASASHVWVRLQRHGLAIVLTIQDDGIGFDTRQTVGRNPLGGNGLTNMRVRAEKLGGKLDIESVLDQGTTLKLQFLLT